MTLKKAQKTKIDGILTRGTSFQRDFIDFSLGIRVGHLEPQERVTQIFKSKLSKRHGVEMVCDRWGRGVYWQWICWVPRPNRDAKPISSGYNFSSGKFFISVDKDENIFQSGIQIERAPKPPHEDEWGITLEKDWDWQIFLQALKGDQLPKILKRLLREGFCIRVGAFSELWEYDYQSWDLDSCRRKAQRFSKAEWGGFQLFWPMPEKEVKASSGPEIIQAVMAVFDEVTRVLNLCMYSPCLKI